MTEATVTEVVEYATRYPDGTVKPIAFATTAGDQQEYAFIDGSPNIEVYREQDGRLRSYVVAQIQKEVVESYVAELTRVHAPAGKDGPVKSPVVVERRVLTVTDPWSPTQH